MKGEAAEGNRIFLDGDFAGTSDNIRWTVAFK